jgi:hypothetical protein
MSKIIRDFIASIEAVGSPANPCKSEEQAIRIMGEEVFGGVFVTKDVYDRFDWRNHLDVSKSYSNTVVHGMNDNESIANVRIIDRTTVSEWHKGDGSDDGWKVYAWRLEWMYATEKQVAWILSMAEEGWRHFKKGQENG